MVCLYDAEKGQHRKYIFFWFEARVSHIPRAKSVLAMVAKAGAVQLGSTQTQVGMDVSKMDGEAVVEDERTKLYTKGNNFF